MRQITAARKEVRRWCNDREAEGEQSEGQMERTGETGQLQLDI